MNSWKDTIPLIVICKVMSYPSFIGAVHELSCGDLENNKKKKSVKPFANFFSINRFF